MRRVELTRLECAEIVDALLERHDAYLGDDESFVIEHEVRIAQMVVAQYQRIEFKLVKELTGSERGSGGFGSTGTQ